MGNTTVQDYPALTINDLWKACIEQRKRGNGNKKILISTDDEGNGYHGLFFSFIDTKNEIEQVRSWGAFHDNVATEDVVLLG